MIEHILVSILFDLTRATLLSLRNTLNDNNVARVKSKRIETSICSIINIKLSTPIFGLPMILLMYLLCDRIDVDRVDGRFNLFAHVTIEHAPN